MQNVRAFNTFNIVQVYQYFTIYRQYYSLKFEKFHEYFIQHSLKSRGTKDRFRWVKVPGTVLIERPEMLPCLRQYIASMFFPA
jgi:hypothetical protein